jgi:hypothetical protein
LFAWCIASSLNPQLGVEDRADPVAERAGERLAIPFADYWRPTAANYWGRVKKAHGLAIAKAILGDRWARDHADDKKPTLAAALETAFDPAANTACIGLDQAARDGAAAWLPAGMAYGDGAADGKAADPELGGASRIEVDHPREAEPDDPDVASSDLPAFLTDDEPSHQRSTGLRRPDAHFRNGDRTPPGARSPLPLPESPIASAYGAAITAVLFIQTGRTTP